MHPLRHYRAALLGAAGLGHPAAGNGRDQRVHSSPAKAAEKLGAKDGLQRLTSHFIKAVARFVVGCDEDNAGLAGPVARKRGDVGRQGAGAEEAALDAHTLWLRAGRRRRGAVDESLRVDGREVRIEGLIADNGVAIRIQDSDRKPATVGQLRLEEGRAVRVQEEWCRIG